MVDYLINWTASVHFLQINGYLKSTWGFTKWLYFQAFKQLREICLTWSVTDRENSCSGELKIYEAMDSLIPILRKLIIPLEYKTYWGKLI